MPQWVGPPSLARHEAGELPPGTPRQVTLQASPKAPSRSTLPDALQASPRGTLRVLSAHPGCLVPEDGGMSHLLPFSSCHSGPDPHCSLPPVPDALSWLSQQGCLCHSLWVSTLLFPPCPPRGAPPALSAHPVVAAPCPCPPRPWRGRCPSLAVACAHPLIVGCGGVAGQGPREHTAGFLGGPRPRPAAGAQGGRRAARDLELERPPAPS